MLARGSGTTSITGGIHAPCHRSAETSMEYVGFHQSAHRTSLQGVWLALPHRFACVGEGMVLREAAPQGFRKFEI